MPQYRHKTMKKNNMIKSTKKKETMKKEKSLTNDLFSIELITCPNCNGQGHLEDTAPENATYELYEDCDICKNVGEIVA